ncbi:MAG: hypothetical protein ACLQM8_24920 [Limisphaerales bacterium]
MTTWILMLSFALWALRVVVKVIGIKATMVLVWAAFAVFVFMVAWAIYADSGGVPGVIAAVALLVTVGLYILNDLSKAQ